MEGFWKASALVLITVILGLAVGKREKDISVLLTMAACCMVGALILSYLEPVLALLWEMESLAQFQGGILAVLLKAAGVAFVAELAGMICKDAGNDSLGKTIQMLGSVTMLSLSLPVFRTFLALIQEILGQL